MMRKPNSFRLWGMEMDSSVNDALLITWHLHVIWLFCNRDATFHYQITGMSVSFTTGGNRWCLHNPCGFTSKFPGMVDEAYNENHINVGNLLVMSRDILVIAANNYILVVPVNCWKWVSAKFPPRNETALNTLSLTGLMTGSHWSRHNRKRYQAKLKSGGIVKTWVVFDFKVERKLLWSSGTRLIFMFSFVSWTICGIRRIMTDVG